MPKNKTPLRRQLDAAEAQIERAHDVLDAIGVPRDEGDEPMDRIIWLVHRGVQEKALEELYAQRALGNRR